MFGYGGLCFVQATATPAVTEPASTAPSAPQADDKPAEPAIGNLLDLNTELSFLQQVNTMIRGPFHSFTNNFSYIIKIQWKFDFFFFFIAWLSGTVDSCAYH